MRSRKSLSGVFLAYAYTGMVTAAYLVAWPVLRLLAARRGRRGEAWRERLGLLPPGVPRQALVIHAASVGEVNALGPFLSELKRHTGGRGKEIVLSTMTETGRRRACAAFGLPTVLAPLDSPACVTRWLEALQPRVLLVMETELWPVWLTEAAKRGPVVWVNGRISDRSFPRYLLVRPLIARIFSGMKLICVIGSRDRSRASRLGARPAALRVTGNVKTDLAVPPARSGIRMPPGRWLVAGSVRAGEEEPVLEAYLRVRREEPGVRLCLAPRHLDRASPVERIARAKGLSVVRRTRLGNERPDVLVLDTHGELAAFYRRACAAYVGGTLVPVGGHNVLEPALAGVPVLFGPYTGNFRDEANGLVRAGGGIRVQSARALAARWLGIVRSRPAARAAGRRARAFVDRRRGVARRLVRLLVSRELA